MKIIIFILFSIFLAFFITSKGQLGIYDGGLYMFQNTFNIYYFLESPLLGEGVSHNGAHLILNLIRLLFGENIFLYQLFFYTLLYFVSFIGIDLIVKNTLKLVKQTDKYNYFISIILGILWLVIPFNFAYRLIETNTNTYFFFFTPLLFGIIFKFLLEQNLRNAIYVIIAYFLSSFVLWAVPMTFTLVFFILIFMILLKLFFNLKFNYKLILFTLLGLILTNLYWLINLGILGQENLKDGLSLVSPKGNIEYLASYLKEYFLWGLYPSQHRGKWNIAQGYFKEYLVMTVYIAFIFLTYLLFFFNKKINYKLKILLLTLFIIFFDISNPGGFFANLIIKYYDIFPILGIYRTAIDKTFSLVILVFLLFVFLNFIFLSKKNKKKYFIFIIIVILVGLFPIISGKILKNDNGKLITYHFPNWYFKDFNELEKLGKESNSRLLILPLFWSDRSITNWGYIGLEPYSNFLQTPFLGAYAKNRQITKDFFEKISTGDKKSFNNTLNKLGIKYIVIRKDFKKSKKESNYNPKRESYSKQFDIIKNNDNIVFYKNINGFDVYENKNFHGGILQGVSNFSKKSPISYNLAFKNLNNQDLTFLLSYSKQWKLYLKNTQGLFTKPLFKDTHKKVYDYANSWTISKQEIIDYVNKYYREELKKEGYPKKLENGQLDYKYYKLNPDGSIDVELTLYFKPQLYFYIGLIISGTTFLLLMLWLIVDSMRERKRKVE